MTRISNLVVPSYYRWNSIGLRGAARLYNYVWVHVVTLHIVRYDLTKTRVFSAYRMEKPHPLGETTPIALPTHSPVHTVPLPV